MEEPDHRPQRSGHSAPQWCPCALRNTRPDAEHLLLTILGFIAHWVPQTYLSTWLE